jgi:hypothetical protein
MMMMKATSSQVVSKLLDIVALSDVGEEVGKREGWWVARVLNHPYLEDVFPKPIF